MRITKALAVVLLCNLGGAALACELPRLVIVPDPEAVAGKEAEIRAEVAEYWQAMVDYTTCVKAELDAAGGENAPSLTKAVLVQRNNVAVAEVEAVAKAFMASVGAIESPGPQPPVGN